VLSIRVCLYSRRGVGRWDGKAKRHGPNLEECRDLASYMN
jgi:hypothetical protein